MKYSVYFQDVPYVLQKKKNENENLKSCTKASKRKKNL